MSFCGCWYQALPADHGYHFRHQNRRQLPLLGSEFHSTILSTTSRTVLTQVFRNPSATQLIPECTYAFPLYDGVSVVAFTCRIGKKVLRGLVKEKVKAQAIFNDAVARGETAGLLQQSPEASDIFNTKLGNIPAGKSVTVEITYIGELKHHDTEGIRFTIPTKIAPRYGSVPGFGIDTSYDSVPAQENEGIKITVDVNMPDGSFIKAVQSPSHPIAVSMGIVSKAVSDDPVLSKASATLSLGSAALEKDFVLIITSKDVGTPKAILESHPTIRNHRALMVTLVPKFSLPPSRPEIVLIADRSGSMTGNVVMLVSALNVFLKSMPIGVKFNICSFGSTCSFLWRKSQGYTKDSLKQAINHVQFFQADMGGTETFGAVKATIERRWGDLPLEIILLTDGDIGNQNHLFEYVNQQVELDKGNIRVFPLGIGNGVSHSLIEGLARAGNGFAQAVQEGEQFNSSVVRMVRGALAPHITDYTLEVKYEKDDDDFEAIDTVTEGMKVLLSEDEKASVPPEAKHQPLITLFDAAMDVEKDDLKSLKWSPSNLPKLPSPRLLQAPHKIPSLSAFSRTSVYLLMSPETIQRNPTAVILRATSAHGPLELHIPIEVLNSPAETIHQLAAKKAVQDLEEGRGWIYNARNQHGVLVKDVYPSRFDDLVQREAVRLGEKFQIVGKWCSFVAISANDDEIAAKSVPAIADIGGDFEVVDYSEEDSEDDPVVDRRRKNKRAGNAFLDVTAEVDEDEDEYENELTTGDSFIQDSYDPTTASLARSAEVHPGPNKRRALSQTPGLQYHGYTAPSTSGNSAPHIVQRTQASMSPEVGFGNASAGVSLFGSRQPTSAENGGGLYDPYSPKTSSGAFGSSQPFANVPHVVASPIDSGLSQSLSARKSMSGSSPTDDVDKGNFQLAPMAGPTFARSAPTFSSPPNAAERSASPLFGPASPAYSPTSPMMDQRSTSPFSTAAVSPAYSPTSPVTGYNPSSPFSAAAAISGFSPSAPSIGRGPSNLFGGIVHARTSAQHRMSVQPQYSPSSIPAPVVSQPKVPESIAEKVLALINLQDFDGSWSDDTFAAGLIMGLDDLQTHNACPDGADVGIWLTLLVIAFLQEKCAAEMGTWEMVVEKARAWVEETKPVCLEVWEIKALEFIKGV